MSTARSPGPIAVGMRARLLLLLPAPAPRSVGAAPAHFYRDPTSWPPTAPPIPLRLNPRANRQEPLAPTLHVAPSMVDQLLHGFRVLIVSDHVDLGALFVAIVALCGGVVLRATSAMDAVRVLDEKPHAVLLDAALPDAAVSVPAHAASLGVPVVAFTFRAADLEISPSLRIFNVRSLRSTDFHDVCTTPHAAAREAA